MCLTLKDIREPALHLWLTATNRARVHYSDDYAGSFECRWQARFTTPDPKSDIHYSIFCSLGDFNTNITDLLTDERFDNLAFHPDNGEILFRYYSRIFLIASEILTDFQDILSVFRNGTLDAVHRKGEKNISRKQLTPSDSTDAVQDLFSFINTVFKHKTRNIHSCNHHMKYYFEDSGESLPTTHTITIQNVVSILDAARNKTTSNMPKNVVIPALVKVLDLLIHGYNVIDQTFQADAAKFAAFCALYEGRSPAPPPAIPLQQTLCGNSK
jgi:hypothetical protein